jgi:hypothetical protein
MINIDSPAFLDGSAERISYSKIEGLEDNWKYYLMESHRKSQVSRGLIKSTKMS